jgi:hypothetical protein
MVLWYLGASHWATSRRYPVRVGRYIFRRMPSSIAVWSFWIAVGACAAGQIAILRDTLISHPPRVPESGTAPAAPASPASRRLHTAGEVMWAVLPGIALVFVLVWTWRAVQSGRAPAPETHAVAPAVPLR